MTEKTTETLQKAETRAGRLRALRLAGMTAGLSEDRIADAERSLLGAFALADFIDAIRGASAP